MVIAAVALAFATPLDLKTLATLPPAKLVARWGAPVREETWTWAGRYADIPSFRDIAKYRDVAPVAGWSRTASYRWSDTPALRGDGLKEVDAALIDGVTVSLRVTTLPVPGERAKVREDLYKGLGLAAPAIQKPDLTHESFPGQPSPESLTVSTSEITNPEPRLRTPITTLLATVQTPLRKEFEVAPATGGKESVILVVFSPEGGPETIQYDFLPIVGTVADSLPSVGLLSAAIDPIPNDPTSFRLKATPDWVVHWSKDEYGSNLSFNNVRLFEAKFKRLTKRATQPPTL